MPTGTADLAERVFEAFDEIHRRVFLGDPAANPRLKVDVVKGALAGDTPVVVLVTPWTLNGLAFPPDGALPEMLAVGGRTLPVFSNTLEAVGPYHSVNLMGDVSSLRSPEEARRVAASLAEPFVEAVAKARERLSVPDPGRRRLFMGAGPAADAPRSRSRDGGSTRQPTSVAASPRSPTP